MIWHDHSKLVGEHAFLGASKYHWLNYTDDQMIAKYKSSYTQAVGTYLHELAAGLIENHMKLSKSDSKLLTYHLLSHGVPRGVFNVDDLFGNFRSVTECLQNKFCITPRLVLAQQMQFHFIRIELEFMI